MPLRTIRQPDTENQNKSTDPANMLAATTVMTAAALLRAESYGGHYRCEFPELNAGKAQRSLLTLPEALLLRVAGRKRTADHESLLSQSRSPTKLGIWIRRVIRMISMHSPLAGH